jgi:hypothetical protein
MMLENKNNSSQATLFALSMTSLGAAIQLHRGALGPSPYLSILWLTIAIALAAAAVFQPGFITVRPRDFQLVVALCLLANLIQQAIEPPDPALGISTFGRLAPFVGGVVALGFSSGIVLAAEGVQRVVVFGALLLAVAYLGNWQITNCPKPPIDVFVFQADSSAALGEGRNPYALTFPSIYGKDESLYGEGVVKDGRLQFGYPYFPEPLLAVMPAVFLHVDLRYAQLVAILATAALIVMIDSTSVGFAAALLFLTTPRLLFVLQQSWTEPFTLLALAATVASGLRWPRVLPIALGLFLASKQYVPFAAVLFFTGSRPARQTAIVLFKSAIVAALLTLPMALWDFHAFWNSVVALQFRQPFRSDALSYTAWMGEACWTKSETVLVPFGALLLAMSLVLWRRKSIDFASAVAFCFLLFFAFNKQAFANYYFFIIGAMGCAIAELQTRAPVAHPQYQAQPIREH